ncbi:DUF2924 domain-containing protein [Endozoicomonas sp. 8E]|uniref:DUF2924 domain-containing protein n=1 Tax=Endozoicomonas sp. 8E TaxID=3035692 RepID=UPI002938FDDE|nr:DUF2924 domain-containing protein [Endozoicomonas sp. 8E]WOG29860.1 DUF2924 domain-containing protein [Endozoicomonas sp. 8E]
MNDKSIAARVLALQKMNTDELRMLWRELNNKPPPQLDLRILRQRLSMRIQELAFGGLSEKSKERLKQASKHGEHKPKPKNSRLVRPPLGTVITKEYNGEEHRVIVTPEGFEYRGEIYKSLSKIAQTITGSSWSGPLFFGLKGGQNASQ